MSSTMWSTENRKFREREGLHYPSDLTDAEWVLVEPLVPPARRGGRPRSVDVRAVLNAILYLLSTGCQWTALPKDLPPKTTVHDYLEMWSWDGTLMRINRALYVELREQEGRDANTSVAIIRRFNLASSQSVKGVEKGGRALMHRVMMRARRSRVRMATFSSVRWTSY
jgi:transposase